MSSHDDVRDLFDFAAPGLPGNPSARIVTSAPRATLPMSTSSNLGLDPNPLEVGDGNETGGRVDGLTGMREAGDDHTIDGGSDPSLGDQRVVPALRCDRRRSPGDRRVAAPLIDLQLDITGGAREMSPRVR